MGEDMTRARRVLAVIVVAAIVAGVALVLVELATHVRAALSLVTN